MLSEGTCGNANEWVGRSYRLRTGREKPSDHLVSDKGRDAPQGPDSVRRATQNGRAQTSPSLPMHPLTRLHDATGSKLFSLELTPGSVTISLPDHYLLCLSVHGCGQISVRQLGWTWGGEMSPGVFLPLVESRGTTVFDVSSRHRLLMLAIPIHPSRGTKIFPDQVIDTLSTRSFRNPFLRQLVLSLSSCVNDKDTFEQFQTNLISFVKIALGMQAKKLQPQQSKTRPFTNVEWSTIDTYINQNIHGSITVSALSKLINLAQSSFVRAFRARTSSTPYQYILKQRVSIARDLILNTPLSLVDVALQTGFADQAHMTSTFSRLSDTTPGRLRRSC